MSNLVCEGFSSCSTEILWWKCWNAKKKIWWRHISMGLIKYSWGHISGHHKPIHVKFGVWGFFIMFYWNIVMKMLKYKKENLMTSHFSTLWSWTISRGQNVKKMLSEKQFAAEIPSFHGLHILPLCTKFYTSRILLHRSRIIQIMNGYECNGTDIFMSWKMKCSIHRGKAEWNISSFTEWKYLFHCTNGKTFIICFI